jgi:hypothetical protein
VKDKRFHFFDVSGLRHHRKAWLQYFDEVCCVLFVSSISSFDQFLVEDVTVNRMADAIVLFNQMVNHPLLSSRDFILFLNKKDIYEQKVKRISIKNYFPEYTGKIFSVSQGIEYFASKFVSQSNLKNHIVTHVTCCTDTKSMDIIIQSVM